MISANCDEKECCKWNEELEFTIRKRRRLWCGWAFIGGYFSSVSPDHRGRSEKGSGPSKWSSSTSFNAGIWGKGELFSWSDFHRFITTHIKPFVSVAKKSQSATTKRVTRAKRNYEISATIYWPIKTLSFGVDRSISHTHNWLTKYKKVRHTHYD